MYQFQKEAMNYYGLNNKSKQRLSNKSLQSINCSWAYLLSVQFTMSVLSLYKDLNKTVVYTTLLVSLLI